MRGMAAITGQSALCPLGADASAILSQMLAGTSAVSAWKGYDPPPHESRIGADLSALDIRQRLLDTLPSLPQDMAARLRPMLLRLPRHVHFSLWLALAAWQDRQTRGTHQPEPEAVSVIVAGHNLNSLYIHGQHQTYAEEPAFLDGLYASLSLDSIHASAVSELLNARGPCYSAGAACASGIQALRCALMELHSGDAEQVYVVGSVLEAAPVELDNMVLLQAVAGTGWNGKAEEASRPFDASRYGFVPAQGGGCLVLERDAPESAVLGQLRSISVGSDAQHLPVTDQAGQERVMAAALRKAGLTMRDLAFISAHATSTRHGDLSEISAIRALCQAEGLLSVPVNAPKSLLGHTLWSAAILETVLALAQLRAGHMHGNANLHTPDPDWVGAFCSREPQRLAKPYALKNAFGFGGYNGALVLRAGRAE